MVWYVPSSTSVEEFEELEIAVDLNVKSEEEHPETLAWTKRRKAWLKITVVRADGLPSMDPGALADPYCVLKFGNEEHVTSIQPQTLEPVWGQSFVFEVDNIPQTAFSFPINTVINGVLKLSQIPLCELLYYIYIDLWDKDNLNRDDYMGRVVIPVSSLSFGETTSWYPVGRTPAAPGATGRLQLHVSLKALEDEHPLERWCIDELFLCGAAKLPNFQLPLLTGGNLIQYPGSSEHVEMVLDDVLVEISGHRGIGRIFLTDFRLIILCTNASSTNLAKTSDLSMWVALNHITSVERGDEQKVIRKTSTGHAGQTDVKTLILKCEDFRTIRLTFLKSKPLVHCYLETKLSLLDEDVEDDDDEVVELLGCRTTIARKTDLTLKQRIKPEPQESFDDMLEPPVLNKKNCVSRMFRIFQKRLKFILWNTSQLSPTKSYVAAQVGDFHLHGWAFYDPELEFARQEVDESWSLCKLNYGYDICTSYPRQLFVPVKATNDDVSGSASFRSKGRIPVLTWFNKSNKTFIIRCSQPKIGALGKFSLEDENLVQAARNASPNKRLVIFDARSMLAAGGNRLKGKGTEDVVNRYHGIKLLFLDIANIHAMRDSIDKLQVVCEQVQENKWLSQLESTHWLSHIRSILKGATLLAHYISEKSTPVLVHCSDGWDRTPQLTALAQVLLDPFYRTFDGFKILIEKDWIAFGHMFRDRLGNSQSLSQRSPVFLQFLDGVVQIIHQFPNAFEFTINYIVRIAEHINSGWFGNFLCNSYQDLEHENVMRSTVSIWGHVDAVQSEFENKLYKKTDETLYPICSLRRLHFWTAYYLRFDDVAFSSTAEDVAEFDDVDVEDGMGSTANTVVWVPDERATECNDCKQKFTGIRRRHHCRACGQVFCNGCTRHRVRLLFLGYKEPERVCDACWLTVSKAGDEHDEYEIITPDHEPNANCFSISRSELR